MEGSASQVPLSNAYQELSNTLTPVFSIIKRNGSKVLFSAESLRNMCERVACGLVSISFDDLCKETVKNLFENATTLDVQKAFIFASVCSIEKDPEYDILATRLLLQSTYKDTFGISVTSSKHLHEEYKRAFVRGIQQAVEASILSSKMLEYDLERLADLLVIEQDALFSYLGLQTLVERYFLKINDRRIETPQAFWLRIAMGLALDEEYPYEKITQFYEVLSKLYYIPSTPTLFHSGFVRAQLSSCFLTTVGDDLSEIFKCIGDNGQLAKWAGGIANDWTNIRATGAFIKSIHATSQGVIPFLKIANDVVVCITKGGIRRGGTVVYLETWHLDIEDFLDLRRNTGDERRRTHDMNTANWIPDLFMKRMLANQDWTLFSPNQVPDLHSLYGKQFEERYEYYESQVTQGTITLFKTISALKLWRKMLTRLFETGHPWITFKDACNIRSPQDHVGVIHSSNLCTEITLNTSATETAVCNLGSINLGAHVQQGVLNEELLQQTVFTAVRMLDNVINLNFYPTKEGEHSNNKHRPIGLGVMGFQDALFKLDIALCSEQAIETADILQEKIAYYAISASSQLAEERGAYCSYKGSKWDRSIFPVDTLDILEKERGEPIRVSRQERMDWSALKQRVRIHGMRNSNVMAIAPTATIANIAGCSPCIEPLYRNIYVKSNVAGEFTIINKALVAELKKLNLWNQAMLEQLKYYDGQIDAIANIPYQMKQKYKGAFEIDPLHMIKITAARGKWIDQSQSHNVFMKGVDGKKLDEIYTTGWRLGLKTHYYLRTLGATQIEKSTLDAKTYGNTQKREYKQFSPAEKSSFEVSEQSLCDLDQSCESCQ